VRRRTFSERNTFSSLKEANQHLAATVKEINDGFVYRRSVPPSEGLLHERKTFHPLPTLEFSTYQSRSARISKYSHVTFESNYYSVPDTYPGKYVTLKYSPDTVELVDGTEVLACHDRRFGRGELAYNLYSRQLITRLVGLPPGHGTAGFAHPTSPPPVTLYPAVQNTR